MTSEKKDKIECNKRIRRLSKKRLKDDEYIEPAKEEAKDRWNMSKDRA